MGKKIGILGGTRFIGFHLAKALLAEGWSVSIFNRGRTSPPEPVPKEVEWFKGSRERPKDLAPFFKNEYDAVIDLSGHFPFHVRPIADRYRAKIGHYVFCSTTSVYKSPPPVPFDENSPRDLTPGTYGGDKALAEDILLSYYEKEKWPVTIFRPQGVFGKYDAGPQAAHVFSRLKSGLPLILGRKASYPVNLLYVSDLVSAFIKAIGNPKAIGHAYGIAGDDVITQTDLIKECHMISGCELLIKNVDESLYPNISFGIPWPEHPLVLGNQKIKTELGLQFTNLNEALSKTWEWLSANPKYLAPKLGRGEDAISKGAPIPKSQLINWKLQDSKQFFKRLAEGTLRKCYEMLALAS